MWLIILYLPRLRGLSPPTPGWSSPRTRDLSPLQPEGLPLRTGKSSEDADIAPPSD